jgi:hypothetical protein
MAKRPWMTSSDLINKIKIGINVPIVQNTFSEEDLLEFATAELLLGQVPSVIEYHQEYFVFNDSIPLVKNQNRYPVPKRAIGMKLRDLFYVDSQDNMCEMVNVGLSNADFYSNNVSNNFQTPRNYYLEGDDVVLLPKIGDVTGSLLAKYYLRPNSLVLNERAGICTNFIKEITIGTLVAGDKLSINGQEFIADTDFAIGATNTASATNLVSAINTADISGITASSSTNIINADYLIQSTTFVSDNSNIVVADRVGVEVETMPEHFVEGMLIDFLQTEGGHKTYAFDIQVPRNGVSGSVVFFNAGDIPEKFIVGDYICEQYECIIPQIPSDLHNLLAERTCARILESLGDYEGAAKQDAKVSTLEGKQGTLISNRVEGSVKKVFNRHSLLRSGKSRRIGRGIN